MTDYLNTRIVKDQKPAGPLTITTPKGTVITQKNDSVWNWENWPNHGQIITGSNPRGTYYVYRGTGDPEEMKTMSPESLQKYLYFIQQAKPRNAWYDRAKQKVTDWLGNKDNEKVQEEQNGGLLEDTFNGVTNIANSALGATNTVVNGAGQIAGSTANLVDTGIKGTSGLLGGIFGALSAPFQLATAAAQRKIQDIRSSEDGGKIQKGEDGMIAGEFSPDWNQGEIRQGFQKARPKWLLIVQDAAEDLNNNSQKYGPLSMLLGPTARYLTGQGGYEDMAAMLPGIGAAENAATSTFREIELRSIPKMRINGTISPQTKELGKPVNKILKQGTWEEKIKKLNEREDWRAADVWRKGSDYITEQWLNGGSGWLKHGGRLMRQGGKIIEVPFEK